LLIGAVWIVQIFFENILLPRPVGILGGLFLAFAAFILPFVPVQSSEYGAQRFGVACTPAFGRASLAA
jgi:hypothetical protein